MRYLYIDIDLAIKALEYREGLIADCESICKLIDKLKEYKKQLDIVIHDNKSFKRLCYNFDSFIKRHEINY